MRSLARIEVSRILKSLRPCGGFCFSHAHRKDSKGPSIGRIKLILWLSAWPAFVSVALSTPLVYVTNSETNIVTVFDIAKGKVTAQIGMGTEPFGIAFSPEGARAYVANAKSATLSVIDTARNRVIKNIPLETKLPVWVAVSPDGSYIYVTNEGSHDLAIVGAAEGELIARVPVGHGPAGVAVSPDGRYAYVANEGTHDLSVIDLQREIAIQTIPVGSIPQGVATSPDGAWVCVANFGSDSVSLLSTASGKAISEIPVQLSTTTPAPQGPTGIAVSPDGRQIYTSNFKSGLLSIIDVATRKAVAAVPVGAESFGVGVDSGGTAIYAVSGKEGRLSVIDRQDFRATRVTNLAKGAFKLAVMPPTRMDFGFHLYLLLILFGVLGALVFYSTRPTVSKRQFHFLLGTIFFFALTLRLIGLSWGIPDYDAETARAVPSMRVSFHMDEDNFLWNLTRVRPEALDFYVPDLHWGTLQFYFVELTLLAAEHIGWVSKPWRESFLGFHPEEYRRLFAAGRLVSAILGSCSILLVYAIARRLGNERSGIWAALSLSILPLHVVNSHYLTSDISMVFFLLLAFFGLLRTWDRTGAIAHLWTGIAFGLAIAAKYNAVFFLPVILLSQILQKGQSWSKKSWLYAGTAAGFLIGEPYVLVYRKEFWETLNRTYLTTVGLPPGAVPSWFELSVLQLKNMLVFGMGIPLGLCALLAGFLFFKNRRSISGYSGGISGASSEPPYWALIGASLLSFFVSVLCIRQPMIRYTLPMITVAVIPLGYFFYKIAHKPSGKLLVGGVVLLTGLQTFLQTRILSEEHTVNEAFHWIGRHVPPGASLAKGWPELPVLNPEKYRITNFYTGSRMADLRQFFHDENGAPFYPDYVLVDNLATFEIPDEFVQELKQNYHLVAEFKRPPQLWKIHLPEWNAPHDWKYSHPEIRIYRRRITSS
jgi:YVTN family beta-propeller protein